MEKQIPTLIGAIRRPSSHSPRQLNSSGSLAIFAAIRRAHYVQQFNRQWAGNKTRSIGKEAPAMKLILVIFGILGASAAHAQNAPWCLQPSGEKGGLRCTYATFQQCLADRQGNGFCIQNSTYQPTSAPIRR